MSRELHVVALSGGKDSTAMALRLREIEPRDYTYVCTPTGNELPEMFDHWRALAARLDQPIVPVMGGTLEGLVHQWNAIPNWRQRWCTRALKIEPFAAWLLDQSKLHERIVSYVGLRADEEQREGGDYKSVPGIDQRYPLREWGWGLADVLQFLAERGQAIPARTDCGWCFFQRLGEWWSLWKHHPDVYLAGEQIEADTGHTWRSPGRDTWPTALKDLRAKFEAGFVPKGADVQPDMFQATQCRVCRT